MSCMGETQASGEKQDVKKLEETLIEIYKFREIVSKVIDVKPNIKPRIVQMNLISSNG